MIWRKHNSMITTVMLLLAVTFAQRAASQFPEAGQPIGMGVQVGPLGATQQYEVTPIGSVNLLGLGPDLVLRDKKILPFLRYGANGTPVYGRPFSFSSDGSILTLVKSDFEINALVSVAGKLRLARFESDQSKFVVSNDLSIDKVSGARCFSARRLTSGAVAIAFTKGDGKSKSVPGATPHSAEFRPFDGAGIWRGTLSYSALGSLVKEPNAADSELRFPLFPPGHDFLHKSTGTTFVVYPSAGRRGVIGAAAQGMFYFFRNLSANDLKLTPGVFVSDHDGNGIRHPGIYPTPIAIANPKTGDSDLLVGDTGSLWFYKFSGRISVRGGPIYEAPVPVLIENAPLSLGALPVITAGDFDGDGLVDLMAGNDAGHFLFVRNIGSSKSAEFGAPVRIKSGGEVLKIESGYGGVQGPTESRWGYTCPTACDWNQDGLLDILFNSIRGDVSVLLQNNPTTTSNQKRIPHFGKPAILKCDTMDMRLVWRTQPAVTNWNLPNRPNCIVVNDQQNRLRRYWQVDDHNVTPGELLRLTNGQPIQMHGKRFSGQLGRTKWQAVDWDQDGNVDLLAGTGRAASIPGPGGIPDDTYKGNRRQASVLFLRNAGSNETPVFEYPRVMTCETKKLEMGIHSCSPLAIDLGGGKLDLLIGEEDGTVLYYPREKLTWPRGQTPSTPQKPL